MVNVCKILPYLWHAKLLTDSTIYEPVYTLIRKLKNVLSSVLKRFPRLLSPSNTIPCCEYNIKHIEMSGYAERDSNLLDWHKGV